MVIGYSHNKAQKHRLLSYNLLITNILDFFDRLEIIGYNTVITQSTINQQIMAIITYNPITLIGDFKMIVQQYQYQLAKHGKWICPECGRKTFVCYVDTNGDVLDESVGKCDRADKCAYHYTPRQYFADNKGVSVPLHTRPIFKQQPTLQPSYIDDGVFKKSLKHYDRNHLITFLNRVFGVGVVDKMIAKYYIGTSQHWDCSTVFWQRDRFGRIHGGKIMQYNPDNGKRVKEPYNRITWVHTALKIPEFNLCQCLFGEHLLTKYPDKFVAIVESEKTAIMLSAIATDCIVLACGGCQNLTIALCEPLRGRNVVLIPDNGKLAEWSEKGRKLRHLFKTLSIVDIMERPDTLQRWSLNGGDDIGDLILACNLNPKYIQIELKEL